MRFRLTVLVSVALLWVAAPALAEGVSGRWAVAGTVEGKDFTLDCRFEEAAQKVSGSCTDGPTGDAKVPGGRSHALIDGRAVGESVSWTYESSYLFITFDVKYAGVRDGDHMSGTVSAAGKTGTFTANRMEH